MMYVPVLLFAAFAEKLELIWVGCRWRVYLFMFSCVLFQLAIDAMLTSATT